MLQPVPMSAATGALGGLLALWLTHERRLIFSSGAVVLATVVGMGFHLRMHVTRRSTQPPEGLANHIAIAGVAGLGVAVVIIGTVILATLLVERYEASGV